VGRTSPIAAVALLACAVVGYSLREEPYLAFATFLIGICFAVYVVRSAFGYASKYPSHAVLDGSELVRYTELVQAAKDPSLIELAAVVSPNTEAPPSLEHVGGKDA
jgi:hypothetical protein